MNKKYLPVLAFLLPGIMHAQLHTGTAILYIGDTANVVSQGKVILGGNITGTGNLVLAGSALQDIDAANYKVPNLVINNIADVGLLSNLNVTNSLTFTAGKVFTNNQLLTILPTAVLQGYSSAKYISTSDSMSNTATTGGVQVTVAAGASLLTPTGPGSGLYNPVTITNSAGPAEQYTIRVSPTAVPGAVAASTLKISWSITEATPGGNTIGLTLRWNPASEPAGFNRANCKLVRSSAGSIAEKTAFIAATGTNPYYLAGTGFHGTSLFGATSDVNALAINAIPKSDESKLPVESISMYPTLVTGNNAQLVIKAPLTAKYSYIITDMSGKTIAKKDIPVGKGDNIVPVTLPNLASGMYMISIYDGVALKKSIKFIK